MLNNSFDSFKKVERPVRLLTKALIVLFWLSFGFELYQRYYAHSAADHEYLFLTMGGGVFSALFYMCIAYFSLLRALRKESGSEWVARLSPCIHKYGLVAVAAFFLYAAVATVVTS